MSVRIMSRVWCDSVSSGASLIVLLAIADEAKDNGCLYGLSMNELAKKSRMSRRQVQRIISELEHGGELQVVRSDGGWNKRHQYRVTVGWKNVNKS